MLPAYAFSRKTKQLKNTVEEERKKLDNFLKMLFWAMLIDFLSLRFVILLSTRLLYQWSLLYHKSNGSNLFKISSPLTSHAQEFRTDFHANQVTKACKESAREENLQVEQLVMYCLLSLIIFLFHKISLNNVKNIKLINAFYSFSFIIPVVFTATLGMLIEDDNLTAKESLVKRSRDGQHPKPSWPISIRISLLMVFPARNDCPSV